MKRQDALIATQKTLTLSDVPLLKKSRKTPKSDHFSKKYKFLGFFLIFSVMVHRTELRFFALQSVCYGASFKLSNTPNNDFHFSAYNGLFLKFSDPSYGGVFEEKKRIFLHFPH